MLQFGEYLPDLPQFGNPGSLEAKNCLPAGLSYKSFPSLSVFSSALDARCQGAVIGRDNDGNTFNFAGNASKLYKLSGQTFSDVSKAGGYSTGSDESWQFTQWGEQIIATNFADNPQTYTMGTSSLFADLTTDLKARYVDVLGDFVVFGNTYDSTDGNVPYRVRWSAIGDPTDYTVSSTTQSDYQDLDGPGGWVMQVVGGEYGVIFQERAIVRMSYVGSPAIFQFDEIEKGRGTLAPNSVVKIGNLIAYLGEDDFYLFDGQKSIPIGTNRIAKTFYNELDQDNMSLIYGALDPVNQIIFWSYPATGNNGIANKVVAYNYSPNATKRWTHAELNTEVLCRSLSEGYTLEGLDAIYSSIEDVPVSLDSRIWTGGKVYLAAFDSNHKLNTLTGSALTATIDTTESEINPGSHTLLRKFRPMIEGTSATITAKIGTRNKANESVTWSSSISEDSDGEFSCMQNARFHRARFTISGGFDDALGVEVLETAKSGRY